MPNPPSSSCSEGNTRSRPELPGFGSSGSLLRAGKLLSAASRPLRPKENPSDRRQAQSTQEQRPTGGLKTTCPQLRKPELTEGTQQQSGTGCSRSIHVICISRSCRTERGANPFLAREQTSVSFLTQPEPPPATSNSSFSCFPGLLLANSIVFSQIPSSAGLL